MSKKKRNVPVTAKNNNGNKSTANSKTTNAVVKYDPKTDTVVAKQMDDGNKKAVVNMEKNNTKVETKTEVKTADTKTETKTATAVATSKQTDKKDDSKKTVTTTTTATATSTSKAGKLDVPSSTYSTKTTSGTGKSYTTYGTTSYYDKWKASSRIPNDYKSRAQFTKATGDWKEACRDNVLIPFIDMCRLDQEELKTYCLEMLLKNDYFVELNDGFIYAEPKDFEEAKPVLLTAHLDTVHDNLPKTIYRDTAVDKNGDEITRYHTPNGIGGDDRCGVYMIMNAIIDGWRPYVLFCEDEEIGCVGSKKFCKHKSLVDSVATHCKFMIELDRKGSCDAVYYSNDNRDFIDWITIETGYEEEWGSCSDISELMPATKVAGVNLSCGYYNAHTTNEYVVWEEMDTTYKTVLHLMEASDTCEWWSYKKAKNTYSNWYGKSSYYDAWDAWDDYDTYYGVRKSSKTTQEEKVAKTQPTPVTASVAEKLDRTSGGLSVSRLLNFEITLCVKTKRNGWCFSKGATKAECWAKIFMQNPTLCMDDITEYSID